MRRRLALCAPISLAFARLSAQPAPKVFTLTARRFRFEPQELVLPAGERVVVEVRSLDFIHGLNVPALRWRADLPPSRTTLLELPAQAPGTIEFLCDNFCGEGHETMHGRFIFVPA
jgi:cytochrome c oxidase subunit 2